MEGQSWDVKSTPSYTLGDIYADPTKDVDRPSPNTSDVVSSGWIGERNGIVYQVPLKFKPKEMARSADTFIGEVKWRSPTPRNAVVRFGKAFKIGPEKGTTISSLVKRRSPSRDVSVAPGTTILFEAFFPKQASEKSSVTWYVDGEEKFGPYALYGQIPAKRKGTAFMQKFDSTGNHSVEVKLFKTLDKEVELDSLRWSVDVASDGNTPPAVERVNPTSKTVQFNREKEEEIKFELRAEDSTGLNRVVWWINQYDAVPGTTALDGTTDTASISFDVQDRRPLRPVILDSEGAMTWFDGWEFVTEPQTPTPDTDSGQISVEGQILKPDGSPAANNTIHLYSASTSEFIRAANTDSDGRFAYQLSRNRPHRIGYYQLYDSGLDSASFEIERTQTPIDGSPDLYAVRQLEGTQSRNLGRIQLPEAYTLEVRVVDGAGDPVPDTQVGIAHWGSGGWYIGYNGYTNSNGLLSTGEADTGLEVRGT